MAGKRPQSLRSLHVCSTATHHEGYTHAHTVTQRASWCARALPVPMPHSTAHRQRHALWLWECGQGHLVVFSPWPFLPGDADRRRSKGNKNNRLGDGGWATATPAPAAASGRLHDENKQPKVVHAALHAAFSFWASQPASQPSLPMIPHRLRCGGVGHHARRRRQSRRRSFIISFPQYRGPFCSQAAGSPSHDLRAGRLGTWGLAESPGHGHHGRITHAGVVLVHTHLWLRLRRSQRTRGVQSLPPLPACWFAAFRFSHSHSDF